MVKIYAARTLPVNPPDAPFVLKRDLLWKGLQRKIRHADEFVLAIKKCTVVSDENNVVVRDCVFEQPNGEIKNLKEEVKSYGDQWIIFRQPDGSTTTNLLSNGPENTIQDLQLTYIFEWDHPEMEEGTKTHTEALEGADKMALMAVRESINQARKLVQDGFWKDNK